MTDEKQTPDADEDTAKESSAANGKNDIVETAIGLAVLGLGAAVVAGGFGLGGIARTLTRGVPSGTPPIRPQGPVPNRYIR